MRSVEASLVLWGLVATGILLVAAGVSGRVLLLREESWRYGTLLVPVIFLIPAAVIGGSVAGVALVSGGYR